MKTIELLNKAVELGFNREKALADIDASLDQCLFYWLKYRVIKVQHTLLVWEV